MSQLTTRQQEIYDFIRQIFVEQQRMPSIREIGERFAIKSPNGISCHLKALAKKGVIERVENEARSIRLKGVKVVLVEDSQA